MPVGRRLMAERDRFSGSGRTRQPGRIQVRAKAYEGAIICVRVICACVHMYLRMRACVCVHPTATGTT